jgi:hypothetical protein
MKPRDGWMTQEYAHEAFEYRDGELFWKVRPLHHFVDEHAQKTFNSIRPGKRAGGVTDGYMEVRMTLSGVKVHRIVFVMHHGFLPDEVDHIDGNPLNNRIENLRAASRSQNMRNTRTQRRTRTGVKGVSIKGKRFCAFIIKDDRQLHLGMFDTLEQAAAARKQAEREQYGEYANDR